MASCESDDCSDISDDIDDVAAEDQDGSKEVFELLKPHLSQPGGESETHLRRNAWFHLKYPTWVTSPCFTRTTSKNLLLPIQFRLMLSKFKTNNSSKCMFKTNSQRYLYVFLTVIILSMFYILGASKEKETACCDRKYRVDLKSLLSNLFTEQFVFQTSRGG